ncbi:MAG: hypothetical protein PHF01_01280 [Methanocorpusculum sp.]|mgnify:CR=1 FL=1|jgi:hypothetical protein|uniref:Uncharacterized protein n=1 Tax=Methanocorpusculum parvum TaxID=2193 RepID=A0AAX0Q8P0_9EURY|nr:MULTISPECIES: hypothetical protein [Methanocorpusculum]MDD2248429.1 hypothetical protein [Methanocorpusculum sp.]MDD2802785.1 hypothetical protein [Methanocorpusculum sp.]MDD3046845.1 hypothetical protein [Methanocorpusculum sp.]MDD3912122.1 hypothetical protein [Methanocorpusculum sp.]MDD4423259.1 hypothetical protein [Methanocorpusculum parvum]
MSKTKAADAVLLLEQLAQVVKEGDNDVREVRIAKLSDAVSGAKCLNVPERKEAEALIKIRDWPALKKYLEEI